MGRFLIYLGNADETDAQSISLASKLLGTLQGVADPRKARGIRYTLPEILFAAIIGSLCGCDDVEALEDWGEKEPSQVLWNSAGRISESTPEPLIANHSVEHNEADTQGRYLGRLGRSLHLESNQIVGDQDAPDLLSDSIGALAPQRHATDHLRLDLTVAKFYLPSFMVQLDEFSRWILALGATVGFVALGIARSNLLTTSAMGRSLLRPIPITSHTTCSAGNRRRRIVAVPVALSASSIQSAGRSCANLEKASG